MPMMGCPRVGNLSSLTRPKRSGQTRHYCPCIAVSLHRCQGVLVLEVLDADAGRRWSRAALSALRDQQAEIDALNVFPVPDGDTGTNLMLTMLVADDALRSTGAETAGAALAALARASVLGARGNSGVIASQLFRGLAQSAGEAAV